MCVHFSGGQLSPETGCVGVYDNVERRTVHVQKCASLAGVELKTLTAKGSFQCAACATAQSKRSKPAQRERSELSYYTLGTDARLKNSICCADGKGTAETIFSTSRRIFGSRRRANNQPTTSV